MIGIILGALAGLTYVGLGVVDVPWTSVLALYPALVLVIVLGFVFGRVAPTPVGTTALIGMVGALIGAVASLTESRAAVPPLVLHAGACLLVQQFTKLQLRAVRQGDPTVVRIWPFIVIAVLGPVAVVGLIQLLNPFVLLSVLAWLGIAGAIKRIAEDRRTLDRDLVREGA